MGLRHPVSHAQIRNGAANLNVYVSERENEREKERGKERARAQDKCVCACMFVQVCLRAYLNLLGGWANS